MQLTVILAGAAGGGTGGRCVVSGNTGAMVVVGTGIGVGSASEVGNRGLCGIGRTRLRMERGGSAQPGSG
jgi:hypothetical protein